MARNFSELKSPEVLVNTIGKYLNLQKDGREFRAPCPFHNEKDPSFTVVPDKGYYHCFGCGAHGDAIDFVMEYEQIDRNAAYDIVSGDREISVSASKTKRKSKAPATVDYYAGIEPAEKTQHPVLKAGQEVRAWNPKRNKYSTYTPSMVFRYPQGYVIRVDIGTDKFTPVLRWAKIGDNDYQWCHLPFDEPRELYMPIGVTMDKPVMVVEGEKAADAAQRIFGSLYDCVAWCGGSKVPQKSDWSFVKGKDVLMWPDMDLSGIEAMVGAMKKDVWKEGVGDLATKAGAASVKYIGLDKSKPKGWDLADAEKEGLSLAELKEWARKFVHKFTVQEVSMEYMRGDDGEGIDHSAYEEFAAMEREESNVVKHPAVVAQEEKQWRAMLQVNERTGQPEKKSLHNATQFLTYAADMKAVFAFNEFEQSIDIVKKAPWDDNTSIVPRKIADVDIISARCWLEVNGITVGTSDTAAAISYAANKRKYNPLQNYLNSLEWDGTSRLESWLQNYMGVEESMYASVVGRKFMIGAVARVLEPGCKMDTMLILEGTQGLMKSSAIALLFSKQYYTDEMKHIGSTDAAMQMHGKWVVEIAEMHAMTKAEATQIKEWITRTHDRYRPPYGRTVVEIPRTNVLLGTMNPTDGYLKDSTGARRFWPVMCMNIDLNALKNDRDQIWAEAVYAYKSGQKWWLEGDEIDLAREEQAERYEGDSWSTLIDEYLSFHTECTSADILKHLEIPQAQWTRQAEMRIGKHLQIEGWVRKRVTRDGVRKYIYFDSKKTKSML